MVFLVECSEIASIPADYTAWRLSFKIMYPVIQKTYLSCSICERPLLREKVFKKVTCFDCKVANRESYYMLKKMKKAGITVVDEFKIKAKI